MKQQPEAFLEAQHKIISSYMDWERDKNLEGTAIIIARTCVENVLKAEIIHHHNIFEITEFYPGSRDQIAEKWKLKGKVGTGINFSFVDYTKLLNNKKLINDRNVANCINDAQIWGNIYGHKTDVLTKSESESIDKKLNIVLDWFFTKHGKKSWNDAYIKPRLKLMYQGISQGIASETKIREESKIEEGLEEAKKLYFKYLEKECGSISFEGIPTEDNMYSKKLKLEEIFIPIHLSKINFNEERVLETTEKNRVKIDEILKSENSIAILAKPGEGKSTLIKSIALAYAFPDRREKISNTLPDMSWFPIFIRCRDVAETSLLSINETINSIYLKAEMRSYFKQFERVISNSLINGTALLLIDGLDEINDDRKRIQFIDQLIIFQGSFPNIHILLTSREAGFREVAGLLPENWASYRISPLIDREIESLTVKWHETVIDNSEKTIKEAKELAKIIIANSKIKDLAQNSLLLTTLLFVNKRTGYLPSKKYILYQESITMLMTSWNIRGHEQLDLDKTELLLAYVSYCMSAKGQQTITRDELKEYINKAKQENNFVNIDTQTFIKQVELRSGLLIMAGHRQLESGATIPVYEFLHLSFQEYLAGKAIANRYLPKVDSKKTLFEILIPKIHQYSWREIQTVTLFLSSSKEDCQKVIEFLIAESKKITPLDKEMFKIAISIQDEKISDEEKKTKFIAKMSQKTGKKITDKEERAFTVKFASLACISQHLANEVKVNHELLHNACRSFAKNYTTDMHSEAHQILGSKYRDMFKQSVLECFFSKYEDQNVVELLSAMIDIIPYETKIENIDDFFDIVRKGIYSGDKKVICISILKLIYYYNLSPKEDNQNSKEEFSKKMTNKIRQIFEDLLKIVLFDDLHYYSVIAVTVGTIGGKLGINIVPKEYTKVFLKGWLTLYSHDQLHFLSSFALSKILHPNIPINKSSNVYPRINRIIFRRRVNGKYTVEALVILYLQILIDKYWNREEAKRLFNKGYNCETMSLFANKIGLKYSEEDKLFV